MDQKIYIVGDSHVSVFGGRDAVVPRWPQVALSLLPSMQPVHLGPVTAHNWNSETSTSRGQALFWEFTERLADRRVPIFLSAGEIDCRAHLLKKMPVSEFSVAAGLQETVNRYFTFIDYLRREDLNIGVLSPPASMFKQERDKDFPYHGSERERNAVTRTFTAALDAACKMREIPFLNQFDFTVDPSDATRRAFYWDGVHLGTAAVPRLVSKLGVLVGERLRPPLTWHLRERARFFKKMSATNHP